MLTWVVLTWVGVMLLLLLSGVYDGARLGDAGHLLRAWHAVLTHAVLTEDLPSPEDLADFVRPTVELVQLAAVPEPEVRLAAVVRQAESRAQFVSRLLLNWTVGVSHLPERVDTRRLPVAELRLRRLRWLGALERLMGLVGPLVRYRPATHIASLRWALHLLVGALRQAERARPERRARLLRDVAHDFALIMHDVVESHGQALGPFLRWRAALPALPPGGGKWKTPFGWME